MMTEPTRKYPLLTKLVEMDRKHPSADALLMQVISQITFSNMSYYVHQAVIKSSVDYYNVDPDRWLFSGVGFKRPDHQSELDRISMRNLTNWMVRTVSEKGQQNCSYALLQDEMNLNSGRVKEIVIGDPDHQLPNEVWVGQEELDEMRRNSVRLILLSPEAATYLLRPGQFASNDYPETKRFRLVKLLENLQQSPYQRHRVFVVESL